MGGRAAGGGFGGPGGTSKSRKGQTEVEVIRDWFVNIFQPVEKTADLVSCFLHMASQFIGSLFILSSWKIPGCKRAYHSCWERNFKLSEQCHFLSPKIDSNTPKSYTDFTRSFNGIHCYFLDYLWSKWSKTIIWDLESWVLQVSLVICGRYVPIILKRE